MRRTTRHDGSGIAELLAYFMVTCLAVATCFGCTEVPIETVSVHEPAEQLYTERLTPVPKRVSTPTKPTDPWAGAETWCDPLERTACTSASDCDSGQRCVTPWWARKDKTASKVCADPWPTKAQRQWRRDRLATLLEFSCSRRDGCDPKMLHDFLSVVALRESTWRPRQRHRLGDDIEASVAAYQRRAKVFAKNPTYRQHRRWTTGGIGLLGEQPAIFVDSWSALAPPEILCREVEAVSVYQARARKAVRGFLKRGIDPTLCDIHRAVSGGKLEPCTDRRSKFVLRAERAGLDPWQRVEEADFGRAPPKSLDARIAWADAIRSAVEAVHPRP